MQVGPNSGAEGASERWSGDLGLRAWVEFLRDMGVYDLYRQETPAVVLSESLLERLRSGSPADGNSSVAAGAAAALPAQTSSAVLRGGVPNSGALVEVPIPRTQASQPGVVATSREPAGSLYPAEGESGRGLPPELLAPMPKPKPLETLLPLPAPVAAEEKAGALAQLLAEIGDCTRCPLAYAGRHTIVFGEGDPNAALMFVGEGPGADEDASGRPFVGKAGQLLNNMIVAMGLQREQVYIANVVKCRPPGNRTPEFAEATVCSQFLLRQIDIVRPKVIVALGSTAATYVLGVRQSLASLRGQWFRCRDAKVAVTYHPAFLLRDPRQKAEAWKDLQRVMAELGLRAPVRGG